MAQSLLQSSAVHLTGTHLTVDQVAAFIESLEKQFRTHSYDPKNERDEFRVAAQCKKRSHASSFNSGPDRSSNTDKIPTHDRSTGGDKI
jgi:hypothetical protein